MILVILRDIQPTGLSPTIVLGIVKCDSSFESVVELAKLLKNKIKGTVLGFAQHDGNSLRSPHTHCFNTCVLS